MPARQTEANGRLKTGRFTAQKRGHDVLGKTLRAHVLTDACEQRFAITKHIGAAQDPVLEKRGHDREIGAGRFDHQRFVELGGLAVLEFRFHDGQMHVQRDPVVITHVAPT